MSYICNEQLKITSMKKVTQSLLVVISIILLTSCFHSDNSTFVEVEIDKESMIKSGYPKRIVNQYEVVRKSKRFSGKSFFIVDTKENLIFLFDKNGKFVAKSPTIDGFDKQSSDSIKIKGTLKSWSQTVKELGFVWNKKTNSYEDTTNKNRIYTPKLVYDYLGKQGMRFFPKGLYKVPSKYHNENFIGKSENTFDVETSNGSETAIAIHGLYKSQYRIENMKKLVSSIGSDFNEINVSENYKKLISENDNNSKFNNSFGCINVPEEFLELTKNQAVESLIFVLGESNKNYLVR